MCRTGNVPSQHKPKDEKYCEFSEERMLTEIGFYEKFECDKPNVWMLNKAQFNHVAKYYNWGQIFVTNQVEIEEAYYVYLNEPEWQKPNKWMRSYDRYFNFYKMLMYSPIQVRFIQMKRLSNKLWKDVS